jgi:hypothetical protein
MNIDIILRRLRGALGNALVWGVGWLVVGLVLFTTMRLVGIASWPWGDVIGYAIRAGILGGAAGGVFAGVISLLYQGRRLSEISWVRFGLSGAVFAGVALPLFLQTMNLLSGSGLIPWGQVLDDALVVGVLGGVVSGGSMKLAQLGDALPPGDSTHRLDPSGGEDSFISSGEGK